MSADHQFCTACGVTNDLHDGPDSCESADAKARILETFESSFTPGSRK